VDILALVTPAFDDPNEFHTLGKLLPLPRGAVFKYLKLKSLLVNAEKYSTETKQFPKGIF